MCVLCGVLWTEDHWTEVGADASLESDGTITFEFHLANRGRRLRDRALRTRYVNILLRKYGLQLQDWEGSSYILRDNRGNSAVVTDLASLWKVAEHMAGRPLDPIDPDFLHAFQQRIDSQVAARDDEG